MGKDRKKGFTMVELVVVFVILAIIFAIAVPATYLYIKKAEFRKNEANAKTVYMAAETMLTNYRASGQWEKFKTDVVRDGMENTSFTDEKQGRIYAVTLNRGAYGAESGNLVNQLLDDFSYDKNMLTSAAIAVEIDVESGQVYAAFYATRCKKLTYDASDNKDEGSLTMYDREPSSRAERMLGYYSVEDVANVVDLEPTRLKVTSINLINSETLSLNWSSNSRHDNLDVCYIVNFYKKSDDEKLFSTTIDLAQLRAHGWSSSQNDAANITRLELANKDGDSSGWAFPVKYENGIVSLVLDAMMSADAMGALEKAGLTETELRDLAASSDTSITRLALGANPVSSYLDSPMDIYATVQAESTYQNMEGDESEYRVSAVATSNTANTLYGDGAEVTGGRLDAELSTFRHLSNIRYCNPATTADFALTNPEMDWESVGVGLYDSVTTGESGAELRKLCWTGSDGKLQFPSIPALSVKHTLTGEKKSAIVNLKLGTKSVLNDTTAENLAASAAAAAYTEYVGMFCESEGIIRGITLENPNLTFAEEKADGQMEDVKDYAHIKGVGIVAGRAEDTLEEITIKTDEADAPILTALLPDREGTFVGYKVAGIGGITGVLAGIKNGEADSLGKNVEVLNLSVSGSILARIPAPEMPEGGDPEKEALDYSCGIGGIIGYVNAKKDIKFGMPDCENHANVSGNAFVGGVVGHMDGKYNSNNGGQEEKWDGTLDFCTNDGLILCTVAHSMEENQMEGRYFGGILGFGNEVYIKEAESTSGYSSKFSYDDSKREALLRGQYVGGILGFGVHSRLYKCSTGRDGYVLGSDYVGGIIGGMKEQPGNAGHTIVSGAKNETDTKTTTNAGYVIGNTYVGGIIGYNPDGNGIIDCVNNGVAAGYGRYIGGIVGYNDKGAVIENCVSYLSDYNSSIYNMIVDKWKATGDCTGGLAGYNNGTIIFASDSEKLQVKSVSSIVVGKDYVGGCIGFNDVKGVMDTQYALIGGRIYAFGDCAGGCIGFNASTELLKASLVMKPQSVQGNYYVGGCIGANVVDLTADVTMDGFYTDNALGTLTAHAFAGGVVGYQRTYTKSQLTGAEALDSFYTYLTEDAARKNQLLPRLDEKNGYAPTAVLPSQNTHTLTITRKGNTADNLDAVSNNLSIRAQALAGGIVGSCETASRMVIRSCRNIGNLSLANADWEAADGVNLHSYLISCGLTDAAAEVPAEQCSNMIGGIIGVNQKNQVIDHCANAGGMTGITGLGGIVGLNAGGVFNSELTGNFGNAGLDDIGGIVGYNVGSGTDEFHYTDVKLTVQTYTPGTAAYCGNREKMTISGHSVVGGIAGYNLAGGILHDNSSQSNITASGDFVGGIAGRNAGSIIVGEDRIDGADGNKAERSISGRNGQSIGGIVGYNEKRGTIKVSTAGNTGGTSSGEVRVVNKNTSISGGRYVGGIVGTNAGRFDTENKTLVCAAKQVRAFAGYAGGIAGDTTGNISGAVNETDLVSADTGIAGGIVPENKAGAVIEGCRNRGAVSSNQGYAGGITAINHGIIRACTSEGGSNEILIQSRNVEEIGAITAVNEKSGSICASAPGAKVRLSGTGKVFGGIAGVNYGKISGESRPGEADSYQKPLEEMPAVTSSLSTLVVGGAAGRNESGALITDVDVKLEFQGFKGYRYLGGITGSNQENASVTNCSFDGKLEEVADASEAGNCYGGIAGDNAGLLKDCEIRKLVMNITGTYTATSTSTAAQKEKMSSHAGAVAGKNDTTGIIDGCVLSNDSASKMTVGSGMLGGVTGYNKGLVRGCGDEKFAAAITWKDKVENESAEEYVVANIDDMCNLEPEAGLKAKADADYVYWESGKSIEDLKYADSVLAISRTPVTKGKMQLLMTSNGNLGGITAYNAPTGTVERCASGNWFLNNKSNAIGVGTGGIIGMNESENDQTYLLNQAFVGRELSAGVTNRFAGGIIGNQNNTTKSGWNLKNSVNYGTVYCYNTHYSGGILGQWTGTGGTIENCRNYGNLQTTYQQGWVGAAGGIVAQLYHAYENNEYNIISCENFGNIYGYNGKVRVQSANDSAGILGNVTNYTAASTAASQRYTIRVLDCVNGPGVEIYSSSMASGIVGFFSCDTPNVANIEKSIANTSLVIERCRNFAQMLSGGTQDGKPYVGGILGDRYGKEGKEITYLYDNFAIRPAGYQPNQFPLISFVSTGSGDANVMRSRGNYFFEPDSELTEDGIKKSVGSFNDIVLYQDRYTIDTAESAGVVKNNIGDVWVDNKEILTRVNSKRIYLVKNQSTGSYVLAEIDRDRTLTPRQATIVNDLTKLPTAYSGQNIQVGDIVTKTGKGGEVIGRILCTLDTTVDLNAKYKNVSDTFQKGDTFYQLVRNRYRLLEGLDATGKKLLAPANVRAEVANGRMNLTIVPQNANCDPFKYEVEIYEKDGDKETLVLSGVYLYAENGSITLPENIGSNLSVRVRAVSMFEDVEASDWTKQDTVITKVILPTPNIRAELEKNGKDYRYRFSLENEDAYALYDNWEIAVRFTDNSSLKLQKASGYTAVRAGKAGIQQIVAQAVPTNPGDVNLIASEEISVPAYMPDYLPSISLAGKQTGAAAVSCKVTGTTLENLAVEVKFDASSSGTVTTPPIYRTELIGDWKNQKNVVFASQDVLISANGTATAVFTDLPDYLRNAENLKVRVWYAETGLGPVYTWHEVNAGTSANVTTLVGVDETGTEIWSYAYSTVLADNSVTGTGTGRNFDNYTYLSGNLFKQLPAPKLLEVDEAGYGPLLAPKYDENGNLYYTFYWDKMPAGQFVENVPYEVRLYGSDEDETDANKVNWVGIDLTGQKIETIEGDEMIGAGNKAYALRVNAENWNFKQVKIQVTRIGNETAGEVGLTSTGIFRVRQRLPKPAQPGVMNRNSDELDYEISWPGIVPETGCGAYEVYLKVSGADSTEKPVLLATVPVDAANQGSYQITESLESYAGRTVQIYVIAVAEDGSKEYVNSVAGVVNECYILRRLGKPEVTFDTGWTYDPYDPLTMEEFRSSRLKVDVQAQTSSIPPGGSTYLLRGYVFETADDAERAARTENMQGYVAAYDVDETGVVLPVPMVSLSSQKYTHTMQNLSTSFAGKWIVFQTRISAGDGNISSPWSTSVQEIRLPYVKLDTVDAKSSTKETAVEAYVRLNPDMEPEIKAWTSRQTVFTWDSVMHAAAYSIDLADRQSDGGTVGEIHRLLIEETTEEDGITPIIVVKQYVPKDDGNDIWETLAVLKPDMTNLLPVTETLPGYQKEIQSVYTDSEEANYYYTAVLQTELTVTPDEDGKTYHYMLTLPDTEGLHDNTGFAVAGTAQKFNKSITFITHAEPDSTAYVSSDTIWIDLIK